MSDFDFGNVDHLIRNLEIEGEIGTELGLEGTDITLIVLAASDANPRWKAGVQKMRNELNRLQNAKASPKRQREYLAGIYADTLVKDWRGVVDKAGNPIPFTREACKAFLVKVDDAFAAIESICYETKMFRGARIEAAVEAGNG